MCMKKKLLLTAALAACLSLPSLPAEAVVSDVRPDFPAVLGDVNAKAVQNVRFLLAPAQSEPLMNGLAEPGAITITGNAEATREQMVAFIRRRNPHPKINCPLESLVAAYYEEAGREGLRADIVLCQAIKETGFFNYGGDVLPSQNNFCGLGATGGGVKGASFATPRLGARAHVQHLVAYATYNTPQTEIIDPRFAHITDDLPQIHGHINNWTGLNGVWAVPGNHYGEDILSLWQQAMAPDAGDGSLQAAETKVRRSPGEADSYIYRGIVFSKRGEHEKALQDFRQALKLAPGSISARFDEALSLSALGKNAEAVKAYDKVLREQPDCIAAWYNRGLLRLEENKYDAAVRDFQQATKLEPRHINAMNNMAIARLKQGKYKEAWETLQAAARTNTSNEYVLGNQFILQACRK